MLIRMASVAILVEYEAGASVKGTKSLKCGSNGQSTLSGIVHEKVLVCCSCTGLFGSPMCVKVFPTVV